jgi:di/tricarboxylate transporter
MTVHSNKEANWKWVVDVLVTVVILLGTSLAGYWSYENRSRQDALDRRLQTNEQMTQAEAQRLGDLQTRHSVTDTREVAHYQEISSTLTRIETGMNRLLDKPDKHVEREIGDSSHGTR